MISLRDYQKKAVSDVLSLIGNGANKILVVAPTGAGKTEIMKEICIQLKSTHRNIFATAHSRPLIEQLKNRLSGLADIIGVKSKKSWAKAGPIDLLFIDEAHHSPALSYKPLLEHAKISIGFTATPYRADGEDLKSIWGDFVNTVSYSFLANEGYLVAPRVFAKTSVDLSNVKEVAGDYAINAISEIMSSNDNILKNLILSLEEYYDRRILIYCCNRNHCGVVECILAKELPDRKTFTLTHELAKNAQSILGAFRATANGILLNVTMLTEGWDMPELDCIILARPTKSDTLHQQMIGRCLRVHADKKEKTVIVDLAGNCLSLGIPNNDYTASKLVSAQFPWRCPEENCRHSNKSVLSRCEKCNALKPSSVGSWLCLHKIMGEESPNIICNHTNPSSICFCEKCGTDRKLSQPLPKINEIPFRLQELSKECPWCQKPASNGHYCSLESLRALHSSLPRIVEECIRKNHQPGWMYYKVKGIDGGRNTTALFSACRAVYVSKIKEKIPAETAYNNLLGSLISRDVTEDKIISAAKMGFCYGLEYEYIFDVIMDVCTARKVNLGDRKIMSLIEKARFFHMQELLEFKSQKPLHSHR